MYICDLNSIYISVYIVCMLYFFVSIRYNLFFFICFLCLLFYNKYIFIYNIYYVFYI